MFNEVEFAGETLRVQHFFTPRVSVQTVNENANEHALLGPNQLRALADKLETIGSDES